MNQQERYDRLFRQHPHERKLFFERPHLTRRGFFQLAGAGVSGAFLNQRLGAAEGTSSGATPKGTAKNVIFILPEGAPSPVDTFDFKYLEGVTPKDFAPETINGIMWPMGVLPKLGQQLSDFAIVRSMRSHALVHEFARVWTQIGRNPAGSPSAMSPHIGSVVAIEKDKERRPDQKFPTFLALNSPIAHGPGYLPAKYGVFKATAGSGGIDNASSPIGQARFNRRWDLLQSLDRNLRVASPEGKAVEDYADFYGAAQGLTFNPAVDRAFSFSAADSARYGGTATGNACLVAYQVIKAQQGTRFIQITAKDGWDHHVAIYNPNANGIQAKGKLLDDALSALLADLKSSGLLATTMVVMAAEFGRTVGKLTYSGGRDHYAQQFAFFAGGGVKGGTVIGATDETGADVTDYGWSRQRYVWPEDIEATIYSAMGIDWTYVRQDDPLHRGFEYVPFSTHDVYGPVDELWG